MLKLRKPKRRIPLSKRTEKTITPKKQYSRSKARKQLAEDLQDMSKFIGSIICGIIIMVGCGHKPIQPVNLIGDINLNQIAYEREDLELFICHIQHPDSCSFNPQQRLNSDINQDGVCESIADLVMMINIVNGDTI